MLYWKTAYVQLDNWILFQLKNNPTFSIRDIRNRIADEIMGNTLEELKASDDGADQLEYLSRIKDGEIEWIK